MLGDRTILHCDMNGFYASVECVLDSTLVGHPVAVCGDPAKRHGIILAKNEQAKKFGVQTAEAIWQARQKCPQLVLVAPHYEAYDHYSRLANAIYERYTDRVEPFGIDESWLDVTGGVALLGDGVTIADSIRAAVREEMGLTVSVGVSFNKIFAKLGSDYKKPDATTLITRQHGKRIVWPLPVEALLYVGRSAKEVLHKIGIYTIGELAKSNKTNLIQKLGTLGGKIHDYANGLDDEPVASLYDDKAPPKSIGKGHTFEHDLVLIEEIHAGVIRLCDSVAGSLRQVGLKCRTVQLSIKDPQFKVIQRSHTLASPTCSTKGLIDTVLALLAKHWTGQAPIRALTVTASQLVSPNEAQRAMVQGDLFADCGANLSSPNTPQPESRKVDEAERAVDSIRQKFGKGAIKLAGELG